MVTLGVYCSLAKNMIGWGSEKRRRKLYGSY
jgi:hypothetical protein